MMSSRWIKMLPAACAVLLAAAAHADDSVQIVRPVDGATVRETVHVRLSDRDLPADGYVAVAVDGLFKTARVLPLNPTTDDYTWDTKEPFTTPDDPDKKQYLQDGPHTISVSVYTGNRLIGSSSVTVRVANKIPLPVSQGIKLSYQWPEDLDLHYQRESSLKNAAGDILQSSSIGYGRTVEDSDGQDVLLRDRILDGQVVNGSQPELVQTAYNLKSYYRTVNTLGEVEHVMDPLSVGDHFGFPVPVLSTKRVTKGDSWQTPIEISMAWSGASAAHVFGESRLEEFEWQNGYPTARVRETFSGTVQFPSDSGDVTVENLQYERLAWVAYNSGRLVRTLTTITVANPPPALLSIVNATSAGATSRTASGQGAFALPGQIGDAPNPFSGLPGQPGLPSASNFSAGGAGADSTNDTLTFTETTNLIP